MSALSPQVGWPHTFHDTRQTLRRMFRSATDIGIRSDGIADLLEQLDAVEQHVHVGDVTAATRLVVESMAKVTSPYNEFEREEIAAAVRMGELFDTDSEGPESLVYAIQDAGGDIRRQRRWHITLKSSGKFVYLDEILELREDRLLKGLLDVQ